MGQYNSFPRYTKCISQKTGDGGTTSLFKSSHLQLFLKKKIHVEIISGRDKKKMGVTKNIVSGFKHTVRRPLLHPNLINQKL